MANFGPKDTKLVLVVGAARYDAEAWIKHHLPRKSEITYMAVSIMEPRTIEGRRFNRCIFTPRAQDQLLLSKTINDSRWGLVHSQTMTGEAYSRIEWPDGL